MARWRLVAVPVATGAFMLAVLLQTACSRRAAPADGGAVTKTQTVAFDAGSPLPTTDAQAAAVADAGDGADAGDAAMPLLVMEPEHLAPPWNHLGRTARYDGMRDGSLVGTRSVLVGCRRLRLLGEGEPRDLPLTLVPADARRCVNVLGSDDTRLFFRAGARLYGFDVSAGAVVWSAPHDPDGHVGYDDPSAAAVAGPVVALASAKGTVVAFDRVTGAPAWTLAPAEATDTSPLAKTELVAAGSRLVTMRHVTRPEERSGGGWELLVRYESLVAPGEVRTLTAADVVRAVDGATGKVAWTAALATANGDPALGLELAANTEEVALVVASTRSASAPFEIVLLDAATGAVRAHSPITAPLPQDEYADPLSEELTFTGGGGLYLRRTSKLARIDPATAAFRWEVDNVRTRPLLARGALFVAGGQAILRALDIATGEARWSYGFGALRVPVDMASAAMRPPRRLMTAGDAGAGEEMVAAFAWTSDDGINRSGEVSLFAPVSTVVARHLATVEALLVDDHGQPDPLEVGEYRVLDQLVESSRADKELRVQLRGNGAIALTSSVLGVGIAVPDKVVDLEQGKPDYRLVFHSVFVGQGCR